MNCCVEEAVSILGKVVWKISVREVHKAFSTRQNIVWIGRWISNRHTSWSKSLKLPREMCFRLPAESDTNVDHRWLTLSRELAAGPKWNEKDRNGEKLDFLLRGFFRDRASPSLLLYQ